MKNEGYQFENMFSNEVNFLNFGMAQLLNLRLRIQSFGFLQNLILTNPELLPVGSSIGLNPKDFDEVCLTYREEFNQSLRFPLEIYGVKIMPFEPERARKPFFLQGPIYLLSESEAQN